MPDGMIGENVIVGITAEPLDVCAATRFLVTAEAGAHCLFVGSTRRTTDGRTTASLYYEAYEEMALAEIESLVVQANTSWPLLRVWIQHRTGSVPVGEPSVVIGVASGHRDAAFEAGRFLIDSLKASVPIWKRETFTDGTREWVGGP